MILQGHSAMLSSTQASTDLRVHLLTPDEDADRELRRRLALRAAVSLG